MSETQDRILFLAPEMRLRIAELCSEEARTLGELAAALGRDPGSLSQPKTMARRGALRQDFRALPTGRKATTYQLDMEWKAALEDARRRSSAGIPGSALDLLFIPLSEVARATPALAEGVDGIEWGADVRGGLGGLLLAVRRDPTGTNAIKVLDRLGAVAPAVVPLHLVRSMSPAQLQDWANDIANAPKSLAAP